MLINLTKSQERNGMCGFIVRYLKEREQYQIDLDDESQILVKPEKMIPVGLGEEDEDEEEEAFKEAEECLEQDEEQEEEDFEEVRRAWSC